jgi:hypothetical protein
MDLDGERVNKLVHTPTDHYTVGEDAIYYISKETGELFKLNTDGTTLNMLPKKRAFSIELINGHPACILDTNEAYGLVVFDKEGLPIFKTSDRVVNVSGEGNILLYKTYESQQSYNVRLT